MYKPYLAYSWLISRRVLQQDTKWNWINKLKALEKLKNVIWLISHMRLPTNSFRSNRDLVLTSLYDIYKSRDEHILYFLRDHGMAKSIWQELRFIHMIGFYTANPTYWIILMTSTRNQYMFLAAMWWIWRRCNMIDCLWESRCESTIYELIRYSLQPLQCHGRDQKKVSLS
jgi:hypothetical protein